MSQKFEKPELLAPAGSFEKMKYAFAYGADAVYAGVPMFSLRARENRFQVDEVAKAVEYAHSLGKKIYLTCNIFAHNVKVDPFLKAFEKMAALKPDGFIIADPGLMMLAHEHFPEAIIHISTQANNVSWAQVKFWNKYLNAERVVLSRELSLKEIQKIHEKTPGVELEAFIHGSICMAYSGRCLLSNYFTGRDPNQGTCAHSCRWQYKVFKEQDTKEDQEYIREDYKSIEGQYFIEEKERPGELLPIDEDEYGTYIMNSRDMCAINYLKDLMEAGVCSFKIEGRSKTLHYLATVIKAYREAIDLMYDGKDIPKRLTEDLSAASNRGFIPGFLRGNPMGKTEEYFGTSYQTRLFAGIVRNINNEEKEIEVEVKNRFEKGEILEILTPKGVVEQKVEHMWFADDPEKNELDAAHGGHKNIIIKVDQTVEEYSLLRKQSPTYTEDSEIKNDSVGTGRDLSDEGTAQSSECSGDCSGCSCG